MYMSYDNCGIIFSVYMYLKYYSGVSTCSSCPHFTIKNIDTRFRDNKAFPFTLLALVLKLEPQLLTSVWRAVTHAQ